MTDPIRDALDRLNDRLLPTLFSESVSAAFLQAWTDEARAALATRPPADDDYDRAALEGLLDRVHLAATDPAAWLGLKQGERHPPAPAASTPLDLDALLSPEGAYERGTGHEDGAQLVSGPHGPEWWIPQYGCDSLDNLLDRLRTRILPYLRPPVAGIDVPGGDGDYGDVMDLCAAEGVDVRIGVPLLKRARDAWKVATPTPAPTPAPALDADTLAKVWREGWSEGGPHRLWATLADYVALAVEAQRAPSGNPPATEEDLAGARQEVAGFSPELLALRLRKLALVQARDGREYSSALCARAAEMIPPASDGEREELALLLIADAECLEAEQPDRMAMTNQQMRRSATLLRQPAPAAVPVAVDGWLPISTAPKDGTEILASDFDAIDVVSWENPPEEPPGWIDRYDQYMHPSWWKPLGDHPPLDSMAELAGECNPKEQADLASAATLLRQPAPAVAPVAVAERPWERQPGWLTPDGECWWCPKDGPVYWSMANPAMVYDGWLLPHWAIPIPQPPQGEEVQS